MYLREIGAIALLTRDEEVTIARRIEDALAEVMAAIRDEMANVAWAIERSIENPLGQPMSRNEEAPTDSRSAPAETSPVGLPRYLLSSRVPANWVPLLSVQLPGPGGSVISRLRRGAILLPDGSRHVQHALGALLNTADPLLLHDEEVPREGARVTRHYQMARWTDGATFLWMAHRKEVGRGEGSSGLRFDSCE